MCVCVFVCVYAYLELAEAGRNGEVALAPHVALVTSEHPDLSGSSLAVDRRDGQ